MKANKSSDVSKAVLRHSNEAVIDLMNNWDSNKLNRAQRRAINKRKQK